MRAWTRRILRTAIGFLVAPLTVAVILPLYAKISGAVVSTGFVLFCVAAGYVAALLLGLPLYMLVLRKAPGQGAVTYAAAGAGIGLAAYAVIVAGLSIHLILALRFADFGYFVYLSRHFAIVGAICGAVSALVFRMLAGRDAADP